MARTQLSPQAYQQFNLFKAQQAKLHGVDVAYISEGLLFSISPNVEKNWHKNIYYSDDLLSRINTGTCDEMICEDIGLITPTEIISGRTNNANRQNPRKPRQIGGTHGIKYTTATTHFDTYITYRKLNEWATSPEFQKLVQNFLFEQKRAEIRMIGWNGVKVAENTDSVACPLGEDVNIGWLERVRMHKPEHTFQDKIGTTELMVGEGAPFKNIDELVTKSIAVIPPAKRRNLVVFGSDDLLLDREAALYAAADNKDLAGKLVKIARSAVSGRPAFATDFFPDNALLITSFDNLAHIVQKGSVHQSIKNNDEYSSIDRFVEDEEFYALGDYDKSVLIEGIAFV